jgi:hypothetical protein
MLPHSEKIQNVLKLKFKNQKKSKKKSEKFKEKPKTFLNTLKNN